MDTTQKSTKTVCISHFMFHRSRKSTPVTSFSSIISLSLKKITIKVIFCEEELLLVGSHCSFFFLPDRKRFPSSQPMLIVLIPRQREMRSHSITCPDPYNTASVSLTCFITRHAFQFPSPVTGIVRPAGCAAIKPHSIHSFHVFNAFMII